MLAEAGWLDTDGDGILDKEIDGKRRQFEFLAKYYKDSPEWDKVMAIYAEELRALGIIMDYRSFGGKSCCVFIRIVISGRSRWLAYGFEVDFEQLHLKFADEKQVTFVH